MLFSAPKTSKVSFYTRFLLHTYHCAQAGLRIDYDSLPYQFCLDIEQTHILIKQHERDQQNKYLLENLQKMFQAHAKSLASMFR